MSELDWAQKLSVWLLPLLFAVTLHEVAHGLAAQRLGDETANERGRLSLNPVRHVDPVGSVLVPGLLLLLKAPLLFGWARPVPVSLGRLRSPKRDMALVALAGPGANLLMALAWACLGRVLMLSGLVQFAAGQMLLCMVVVGIFVNCVLLVLNLLPLPPLDGGRVLVGILPLPLARWLARIEPWGVPILVMLLLTRILDTILGPVLAATLAAMSLLLGLEVGEFDRLLGWLMPRL